MKRIAFRLLALCIGVLLSFLVLEICFRLFRGNPSALELTTAQTIRDGGPYHLPPHQTKRQISSKEGEYDVTIRTNNIGTRGKEVRIQKEPGVTRIVMVGDSFTFGVGAEENQTIPYHLEERLNSEGHKVEVVNGGLGDTSPLTDYLRIREQFLRLKPDLLMLLLDITDLQDDWRDEQHLVRYPDGTPHYIDYTIVNGRRDWWRVARMHSTFCKYLHDKVVRSVGKIRTLGPKKYLTAKLSGKRSKTVIVNTPFLRSGQDPIEYDHFFFVRGRDRLPEIRHHWKRTEKYILMIRDMLAENNIPFILVTYPHGIHVGPEEWGEGRALWGFERGKHYSDPYAFELIENFAKANGIPIINLLNDFLNAKAAGEGPLFFELDGHMTPKGNRVAADGLGRHPILRKMLEDLQDESGSSPS